MKFLAKMMLILAGVSIKYTKPELSEDSLLGLAMYTGFYYLGSRYLDRHIKKEMEK
jgi:hypothetical protein